MNGFQILINQQEEINKLKCEDVIYPDVDTIDNNCLK